MTTLLALDIGGTKVGWGIAWAGDTYEVTERGSIPTDAGEAHPWAPCFRRQPA